MTTFRPTRVAVLGALACAALMSSSARAETLRYKFKEGDKSNYVVSNDVVMKIDLSGSVFEITYKMTFDMTWIVKSVDADGSASITQKMDRVQVAMNSPIQGEMVFDSAGGPKPEGPAWQAMGGPLEAMVGQEFSVKVSPLGKVSDVKLPEKVTEVLGKQGGRQGGPRMNLFGADQIKEQLDNAFVLLPEKAAEKGAKWDKKSSSKVPRLGTMNTDITYSLKGVEKKGADDVAKIDATTQVTFEPAEGSDTDAEITEQKGTGEVLFNVTAGKTDGVNFQQKTVMNINAQGREITQEVESKRSLKPGKSTNLPPADKKPEEKKDEAKKK